MLLSIARSESTTRGWLLVVLNVRDRVLWFFGSGFEIPLPRTVHFSTAFCSSLAVAAQSTLVKRRAAVSFVCYIPNAVEWRFCSMPHVQSPPFPSERHLDRFPAFPDPSPTVHDVRGDISETRSSSLIDPVVANSSGDIHRRPVHAFIDAHEPRPYTYQIGHRDNTSDLCLGRTRSPPVWPLRAKHHITR